MLRYSGGFFEICSLYVYAVFRVFRYSDGLIDICSPYVCAAFRLIRYSDGLIDICSPYIVLRYGEQLSEIFLLCLKSSQRQKTMEYIVRKPAPCA